MNIGALFAKVGHAIASFFSGHQATIQTIIADAQAAAGAAVSVATITGNPEAVGIIRKVSDGLTLVGNTVTAESSAETLSEHATNIANLTTELVSSGDVGVKNPQLQAAVGAVAVKAQSVVGALETAAQTAPNTGGQRPDTMTAKQ